MASARFLRGVSFLGLSFLALAGCKKPRDLAPAGTASTNAPTTPAVVKTVVLERETDIRESSGLVLARLGDRRLAFAADEDDQAIVEIEVKRDGVAAVAAPRPTTIGTRPRDLLLLADGTIAATLPDANAIAIFAREETGGLREIRRTKLPVEPISMGLAPKDDAIYVTTGASHQLVALTAPALEERGRWDVPREPRAVLVSADGARVFVSHAAESVLSTLDVAKKTLGSVPTGNGSGCFTGGDCAQPRVARHANALVRIGEKGIVIPAAQVLPKPPIFALKKPRPSRKMDGFGELENDPFSNGGGGGPITGYGVGDGSSGPPVFMDLATVDETDGSRVKGNLPVMSGSSCLLPRAAIAIKDEVYVACMGSDAIEQFANPHGRSASQVSRRGTSTPRGPSALAADRDGTHVVAWSSFARVLSSYETSSTMVVAQKRQKAKPTSEPEPTKKTLTNFLAPQAEGAINVPRTVPRDAAWLAGRSLFFANNDPRISSDGRACGSCHVDGRDDGITWDTPMGPRRTRVLAGQVATGPYGWKGEHLTLEDHVKITFTQLGGKGLPDADLSSLLTYVRALPKPPLRDAGENARGKELFASAECSTCHGNNVGDRSVHDVGTGGGYMTPTLAGIGTKKQLMHDGRYATLDDLLVGAKSMGTASTLSEGDRRALVSYLETL